MKKILEGVIVSVKMQRTVVVSVMSQKPHPLYKKLIKRHNKINADISTFVPKIGDKVKIVETPPISKTKHFKIMEVARNGTA